MLRSHIYCGSHSRYGPPRLGNHRGRDLRQPVTLCPNSGSREWWLLMLSAPPPFFFIQSGEWDDSQQEGLPASVALTSRIPDRCSFRLPHDSGSCQVDNGYYLSQRRGLWCHGFSPQVKQGCSCHGVQEGERTCLCSGTAPPESPFVRLVWLRLPSHLLLFPMC